MGIMVSVVIPAHDEAAVIGRLLARLQPMVTEGGDRSPELEVVVVCNGCTDDTAAVAAAFTSVRVIETPVPSKREALRLGDAAVTGFPRFYIDADVEIDRVGVLALAAAMRSGRALAAAPRRRIPRDGTSRWVRWYYDVWEELPGVRDGIFGRGVIGLSEQGFARISTLPLLMSDDLAMSSAFSDAERQVVNAAVVTVHPPKTWADLIRRRSRVATGTSQAYADDNGLISDSRTGAADLIGLCRRRPGLALRMPVFLAAAILARRAARRAIRQGDFSTWQRDDSSRVPPVGR
jgi:glycosyltransferase involved in cell wall biosynthesis